MRKLSILELDWEDGKQYLDTDTGTIWTMKRGTLFTNGVAIGSHERMRDIVKMQFIEVDTDTTAQWKQHEENLTIGRIIRQLAESKNVDLSKLFIEDWLSVNEFMIVMSYIFKEKPLC